MPSSKGEPDNPKLREKVKEEVKAMSKGGGPGSWSAWKAGELARRYEAEGGGYIDKGEHKNKSQKGPPEKKDEGKKEEKKGKDDDKEGEKAKDEDKDKDKGDDSAKKNEKQEEKKEEGKSEKGAKGGKGKAGAGKKK